eukprot:RCo021845
MLPLRNLHPHRVGLQELRPRLLLPRGDQTAEHAGELLLREVLQEGVQGIQGGVDPGQNVQGRPGGSLHHHSHGVKVLLSHAGGAHQIPELLHGTQLAVQRRLHHSHKEVNQKVLFHTSRAHLHVEDHGGVRILGVGLRGRPHVELFTRKLQHPPLWMLVGRQHHDRLEVRGFQLLHQLHGLLFQHVAMDKALHEALAHQGANVRLKLAHGQPVHQGKQVVVLPPDHRGGHRSLLQSHLVGLVLKHVLEQQLGLLPNSAEHVLVQGGVEQLPEHLLREQPKRVVEAANGDPNSLHGSANIELQLGHRGLEHQGLHRLPGHQHEQAIQ